MSRHRDDGRVRVMLPFRDGPRGEALRVARWALPGRFEYNFGWPGTRSDGSEYEGHPCAVLDASHGETHGALVSYGDQIAPRFMPYRCLRSLDDAARETLAALKAAGRLHGGATTTITLSASDFAKEGDTVHFGGRDYKVVAIDGTQLSVRAA